MPYAINLECDLESSSHIERLYIQLAELGVADDDLIRQYGPCVTLLVIGDVISSRAVARLLELRLPTFEVLTATLTEPCVIHGAPPTLGVRVRPAEPLLAMHHALYSEFSEDDVHLHYRPAHWQPHLKLCNVRGGSKVAGDLLRTMASGWRPRDVVLDGLAAVRYLPVQPVWQARLKQSATN